MPGNGSSAERDLPDIASLYDLLYVDGRRVATYLAQLDPNGTLTGIKATVSGSITLNAHGRLSAGVASGDLQGTEMTGEGQEKQFDPLWILPITLMDRLDELGFIHRGLAGAPIGGLVLINGLCRIIDVAAVKDMWPLIGRMIATTPASQHSRTRNERRAQRGAAAKEAKETGDANEIVAGLAQHLPHALELHLLTERGAAWATLDRDNLISSAQDIALKHGTRLPGEWHMLGILDAESNEPGAPVWDDLPTTEFAAALLQLLEGIRGVIGRPPGYFGITPLLLFRTVLRAGRGVIE